LRGGGGKRLGEVSRTVKTPSWTDQTLLTKSRETWGKMGGRGGGNSRERVKGTVERKENGTAVVGNLCHKQKKKKKRKNIVKRVKKGGTRLFRINAILVLMDGFGKVQNVGGQRGEQLREMGNNS